MRCFLFMFLMRKMRKPRESVKTYTSKTLKILDKYESRGNLSDQYLNKRKPRRGEPGVWSGM